MVAIYGSFLINAIGSIATGLCPVPHVCTIAYLRTPIVVVENDLIDLLRDADLPNNQINQSNHLTRQSRANRGSMVLLLPFFR